MAVAIDGVDCPIEGEGKICMTFKHKNREEIVNLNNVLYSPRLRRNLISGTLVEQNGGNFEGKNGQIRVFGKDGQIVFRAQRKRGLYYVYPSYPKKAVTPTNVFNVTDNSLSQWHKKYCHVNCRYIVKTGNEGCVRGLPNFKTTENVQCETCRLAKSKRISFKPIAKVRSSKPLELVHMDLCGPMPVTSKTGYRYFLSIIDDFSRKVTIFPLKEKTEVFDLFKRWQKRAERFTGHKVINVRTDQGLEFCHKQFEEYLEDQGIRAERSNSYSPEQNGVSERLNYTAVDAIRALLQDSPLKKSFWDEAVLCFAYTWNRLCHHNQTKTPFELFSGNSPSVKHLKSFGTIAYVGTPKQLRRKLDSRAKRGIMVGYAMRTKGYRIWIPEDHKVIETINVRFTDEPSGRVLEPSVPKQISGELESDTESENEEHEITRAASDQGASGHIDEPARTELEVGSSKVLDSEPPLKVVSWTRKAVPRAIGNRHDIYYYPEMSKARLRSHRDVENFCKTHGIKYNMSDFNFNTRNTYSGPAENINKTEESHNEDSLFSA